MVNVPILIGLIIVFIGVVVFAVIRRIRIG